MKLKIEYKDQKKFDKEDLLLMKQYIENKNIQGLKKISLTQNKIKKGEMGPGLGGAIAAIIGSATGPLSVMFQALVDWVNLHRSDVKIKLDNGEELIISANLRRSKKAINEIVETFVSKTLEVRQKAPGDKKEKSLPPPPPPQENEQQA